MIDNPSFWSAMAFLFFLILLLPKFSRIIAHFLDQRALEIEEKLLSSENLLSQAQKTYQNATDQYSVTKQQAETVEKNIAQHIDAVQDTMKKSLDESICRERAKLQESIAYAEKHAIKQIQDTIFELSMTTVMEFISQENIKDEIFQNNLKKLNQDAA